MQILFSQHYTRLHLKYIHLFFFFFYIDNLQLQSANLICITSFYNFSFIYIYLYIYTVCIYFIYLKACLILYFINFLCANIQQCVLFYIFLINLAFFLELTITRKYIYHVDVCIDCIYVLCLCGCVCCLRVLPALPVSISSFFCSLLYIFFSFFPSIRPSSIHL